MPEFQVLCGNARDLRRAGSGARKLRLQLDGPRQNVQLRLQDITRRMVADVPPLLTDLVEIAAYVFAADEMVPRGGPTMPALGRQWRRRFHFMIPVRRPDAWMKPEVLEALSEALGFMSEDDFNFEFAQHDQPPELGNYLELGTPQGKRFGSDEILLFSGGMDSLCGALVELAHTGKRLLLVSHQSSTKMAQHQKNLAGELRRRFPERVFHVPVRAGVLGERPREFTQRTRSLLFSAIAAAVSVGARRHQIRFYENGIVSCNLPIAGQVIGARASRTTHPRTLQQLERLLSLPLEKEFSVHNPFIWKTRSEVALLGAATGHPELIGQSISCSRIRSMTSEQPHCGVCSQCLDRRFATLAAGLSAWDPGDGYRVDLFTGPRDRPDDITMAESYVRHGIDLRAMTPSAFASRFANELARLSRSFPEMSADEVVLRTYEIHQRHAENVVEVLGSGIKEHARDLVEHRLPTTCLLRLAVAARGGTLQLPDPPVAEVLVDSDASADARDFGQTLDIEMALAADGGSVVFQAVGPVPGRAPCLLLERLIKFYLEDRQESRSIDQCRFTRASVLAESLGITEETLRRRISVFRKNVAELYQVRCGLPLRADAIIETKEWKGYRLNPRVRLVSIEGDPRTTVSRRKTIHVTSRSPGTRSSTS